MNRNKKKKTGSFLDDDQIIDLYWHRDEKAIEETDLKYRKYLSTIAYNIVHDTLDVEECLSDTYMRVWKAIPPTKPKNLKAFLITVIRRVATDRYNNNFKKRNVPSEFIISLSEIEDLLDDNNSVDKLFESQTLGEIINDFLNTLSERKRFIFISRYYISDTVDKIAGKLCVSRSTVNKELALIRSALKERLKKEGYSI